MALPGDFAATLTTDQDIDPLTGLPRKKASTADPAAPVPPIQPVADPSAGGAAVLKPLAPIAPAQDVGANTDVLKAAQTKALTGFKSPTLDLTQQRTDELLKDPSAGFDLDTFRTLQQDQFNRDQANQFERVREGTAPIAGSGRQIAIEQQQAMDQSAQRGEFGKKLGLDIQEKKRADLFAALGQGREQVGQESGIYNQGIQNLLGTRAAAEGAESRMFAASSQLIDIGAQKDLAAMQQKFQTGERLGAEDYARGSQTIDNALKLAVQNNDINAQKELQGLKFEFDANQAGLDREQAKTMLFLSTGEQQKLIQSKAAADSQLLGQGHAYELELSDIKQKYALALQSGDTKAQADLLKLGGMLQQQRDKAAQEFDKSMALFDRDTQTSLMTLKDKLDAGQLVKTQDFAAGQAQLDRELQKALQSGDFEQAIKIQEMQQKFQADQGIAERTFADSQRIATQGWQTGERLSEEDYNKGVQYAEYQHQDAMQKNDIDAQERAAQTKASLDLSMQTNGFTHDEKMTYLAAQLAEAKATGDTERQKQLMTYGADIDFHKLMTEQGFEAAQADLNRKQQTALQSGDFAQAQLLQRKGFEFQADESMKDRQLEQAKISLQEKGINNAELETRYNQIYQTDPAAAAEYLKGELSKSGVTVNFVDEQTAMKAAFDADYKAKLYQFAQTHPDLVIQAGEREGAGGYIKDGAWVDTGPASKPGDLTPAGIDAFNDFYNASVYGAGTVAGASSPETAAINALPKLDITKPETITAGQPMNYNGMQITPSKPTTIMVNSVAHLAIPFVAADGTNHWIDVKDGSLHKA